MSIHNRELHLFEYRKNTRIRNKIKKNNENKYILRFNRKHGRHVRGMSSVQMRPHNE